MNARVQMNRLVIARWFALPGLVAGAGTLGLQLVRRYACCDELPAFPVITLAVCLAACSYWGTAASCLLFVPSAGLLSVDFLRRGSSPELSAATRLVLLSVLGILAAWWLEGDSALSLIAWTRRFPQVP